MRTIKHSLPQYSYGRSIALTATLLAATLIWSGCSKTKAGGIAPNQPAPAFKLKDTNGNDVALSDFRGKFVVLEWLNHGCPYVKKHYNTGNMQKLQKEIRARGVVWLSINSSAEGKQGHYKPAAANALTKKKGAAPTALLLDWDGKTGRDYRARTTPHMFVINPKGKLIYQGAIDDNSSSFKSADDVARAKNYVRQALDEAMAGKSVSKPSTRPYGCSVKYKT